MKVPFTAVTNISKGAIAKAAAGCSSVIGAVFCAATAAQLLDETLNHPTGPGRYRICPSGVAAFVCIAPEPSPTDPPFSDSQTGWYTSNPQGCYLPTSGCSITAAATAVAIQGCGTGGRVASYGALTAGSGNKYISMQCYTADNRGPFGAGNIYVDFVPSPYSGTPVAALPSDIETTLQQRMDADFAANRRLYDAMKTDQANNPNNANAPNPVSADTPVSVTAPPTTSPERVVSETKTVKPDGSTDTTTKTEKTVVSPTTNGTTVGNSKTDFPSQTVTNSTTVNNVTNTTTTETTTINHPLPVTTPTTPTTPGEFPDDYNKEVTQQKILDELSGDAAPQTEDIYTKKEKTFEQVLTSFNDTVKASPFISAANAYFTVSIGGGACPAWKATVPYLNMVVDVGQFFCSSLMSSVFGIIAAGLMMAASYVSFRWAFL